MWLRRQGKGNRWEGARGSKQAILKQFFSPLHTSPQNDKMIQCLNCHSALSWMTNGLFRSLTPWWLLMHTLLFAIILQVKLKIRELGKRLGNKKTKSADFFSWSTFPAQVSLSRFSHNHTGREWQDNALCAKEDLVHVIVDWNEWVLFEWCEMDFEWLMLKFAVRNIHKSSYEWAGCWLLPFRSLGSVRLFSFRRN